MEIQPIENRFEFSGLFLWKNRRWNDQPRPTPEFNDLPEDSLTVKKVYVDKTTGKLIIQYEDEEE